MNMQREELSLYEQQQLHRDRAEEMMMRHPCASMTVVASIVGCTYDVAFKSRKRLGFASIADLTRELAEVDWSEAAPLIEGLDDEEAARLLECDPVVVRAYRSHIEDGLQRGFVQVPREQWEQTQADAEMRHSEFVALRESTRKEVERHRRAKDRAKVDASRARKQLTAALDRMEAMQQDPVVKTIAPCRLNVSDVVEANVEATVGDRRRARAFTVEKTDKGVVLTAYSDLGVGVPVTLDEKQCSALIAELCGFQNGGQHG